MTLRFQTDKPSPRQAVIDAARVRLRPVTLDDAESIFPAFTADITEFMIPKPASEIADTEAFINQAMAAYAAGTDFNWVISDRESGSFLGVCGLHSRGDANSPELGIWLGKQAHGHGFGFEAISAVVAWVPDNIVCRSLTYPVDKRNTPSRKIPEKLGGKIIAEKTVENMSGFLLEEVIYQIPIGPGSA